MQEHMDKGVRVALARLKPIEWRDNLWRIAREGRDPLHPNTRGARWNPAGVAALYASVDRDTAVAEWRYRMSLEPQAPSRPFHLHRLSVELVGVLDIRDRAVLEALGVRYEDLRQSDPVSCRMVGQIADWMHQDGLLVPSVRSKGSNLVLLKNQVAPDSQMSAELVDILRLEPE
jgi:RES domain-containing protein